MKNLIHAYHKLRLPNQFSISYVDERLKEKYKAVEVDVKEFAQYVDVNKTAKIKKIYFYNEKILLGNLTKGEYVLEIVASYDQGNAYYGLKILVE